MSGWDQRYDIESHDDRGSMIDDDGRLWWMIAITALAVLVALFVWVIV